MSVNKMFEELCTELYARYLYFECPLCALCHMDGAKGNSIIIYKPKKVCSVENPSLYRIEYQFEFTLLYSLSFLANIGGKIVAA